jgi:hypothetical protein
LEKEIMNELMLSQARLPKGAGLDTWRAEESALVSRKSGTANLYSVHDAPDVFALVQEASDVIPLVPSDPPVGRTRYALTQVSDTGPSDAQHHYLLIVAFCVPPELFDEVEAWYNEEHIGLLRKADGWLRARRYHVKSPFMGPKWTTVALHELRDLSVLDSEERRIARATPWRARLASEPWFEANGRWVYKRL